MKALEILKQVKELSGWIKCGAELPFDEELDEAIAELEKAMKPKTCEGCDNNHKDRTIFYDGKKALMCTFCKYGAVSYFKQKDNA